MLGTIGEKRLLITVEAKAEESFGNKLGEYYDLKQQTKGSNVPARIDNLAQTLFGRAVDAQIRQLRYQLLHATAASSIEAARRQCDVVLFLVHEFVSSNLREDNLKRNAQDWTRFLEALKAQQVATCRDASGPLQMIGNDCIPSGCPLYLGKIRTQL